MAAYISKNNYEYVDDAVCTMVQEWTAEKSQVFWKTTEFKEKIHCFSK